MLIHPAHHKRAVAFAPGTISPAADEEGQDGQLIKHRTTRKDQPVISLHN
jgi:hypothetical protein